MGEVISIKRSNDDDLFDCFQQACTTVPANIDEIISQSAARALGGDQQSATKLSFKGFCFVVGGVCLVGMLLVKGVTMSWNNAVDSAARSTAIASENTQSTSNKMIAGAGAGAGAGAESPQLAAAMPVPVNSDYSWRHSRAAWAEYIGRLENDPYYQYVQQEKRRFDSQYPD